MKKVKIFLILLGMIGIVAFSCKKNKLDSLSINQNLQGLILYYGDPAVDGCGWMIEINKVAYSPILLDSTFRKDSLKVILDYQLLASTWNCGWRSPGYNQIEIKAIKKQ